MKIDWIHFTPIVSLIGGILIGLAASLLILFNARIAGISGIVAGLLRPKLGEIAWRIAFVLGILIAPLLYQLFTSLSVIQIEASNSTLIVSGLLVGLGTRYGGGCTSGHGVCGLSRFSFRSLIATTLFMISGFITVFVIRHLIA